MLTLMLTTTRCLPNREWPEWKERRSNTAGAALPPSTEALR